MDSSGNKIECPNCGQTIDVQDILYHQVDAQLKKKYNDELLREKSKFESERSALGADREQLEKERQQHVQQVAAAVKAGIESERKQLTASIKAEIDEQQSKQLDSLRSELTEKSEQLKEFNKAKSTIERLTREKDGLKDAIEAESEKKLSELLATERERITKLESERSMLRLSEKEHVIAQLNEQLKDAQRKAEQGSMQLQGEVQELAIEDWLRAQFPLDEIVEIKKGARGADCLQIVNTQTRQNCGSIYYESKRTKGFQPTWLEKFKNDIREKNADIGVLVTESMPNDMPRMGLRDGIWVCSFDEFRGLCWVLRESVVRVSLAIATQENKGDKMTMLYDYLTGNEFRLQVEAIVEGFTQMSLDLDAEKRSMQSLWKKREKQIQKVLLNTNHMYSSIKGIAGNAVKSVPLLELPTDDESGPNK